MRSSPDVHGYDISLASGSHLANILCLPDICVWFPAQNILTMYYCIFNTLQGFEVVRRGMQTSKKGQGTFAKLSAYAPHKKEPTPQS